MSQPLKEIVEPVVVTELMRESADVSAQLKNPSVWVLLHAKTVEVETDKNIDKLDHTDAKLAEAPVRL